MYVYVCKHMCIIVKCIQYYTEVTIGFGRSSYTIDESDGSVMFMVHVTNGSLSRPVQVGFSTEDETANGKFCLVAWCNTFY